MQTKFTPGPWKAAPYRNTDLANSHLIAAAPELYEALVQMVDEKVDYMRLNLLGDPEEQHTVKAARAAIAKARGEAA